MAAEAAGGRDPWDALCDLVADDPSASIVLRLMREHGLLAPSRSGSSRCPRPRRGFRRSARAVRRRGRHDVAPKVVDELVVMVRSFAKK